MRASQVSLVIKNPPTNAGDVRDMGWEDPLKKGMVIHSSILPEKFHLQRNVAGYIHSVTVGQDWSDLARMHA